MSSGFQGQGESSFQMAGPLQLTGPGPQVASDLEPLPEVRTPWRNKEVIRRSKRVNKEAGQ